MKNILLQVVNTGKQRTSVIEDKFAPVIKSLLWTYISMVNHAYFDDLSPVNECYKSIRHMCTLTITGQLKFDIRVQVFSSINQIVRFHIDMTKPNTKKKRFQKRFY